MSCRGFGILVLAGAAAVCSFGQTDGLRAAARRRGFLVGAAVNPSLLAQDAYASALAREFNLVVAENAMKFAPTEPARGEFNFDGADRMAEFARAHGMKVRGHNLVWHQSLPKWLTEGSWSREEAMQILHDHIRAVMAHFKGKLLCWDVVNEAIAYGQPFGPQKSFWLEKIGPEYVDMAFRWAREADPDVKLYYNETGGEGAGAKSDATYKLVKGMRDRGVPIDGVGLQMHVTVQRAPTVEALSANIKRLGKLGLEVQITEMDVRIPVPVADTDLIAQADVYRNVARACLANSNCKALITWGVSDAHSWIPAKHPGFGAALLFDAEYRPKPAYQAVVDVLGSR